MKLLLVCTSGGHFSTMKSLQAFWSKHETSWVCDLKADTKVLQDMPAKIYWLPYQAPRDFLAMARNLPETLNILRQEKPDLVLSTGASVAINFGFASKLLGIRFGYIESVSRSRRLSLSGRIVYFVCDEFYVQWPELCHHYPRAVFQGYAT
jgi:beta-1,4-N-acetylglucosaminyltransferase